MRLIISLSPRVDDGDRDASHEDRTVLAVVERRDRSLSQLGLTLAEGRSLLAEVQSALVSPQVAGWVSGETTAVAAG